MRYEKIWKKILSEGEKVEYEFSVGDKYIKFGLLAWAIICTPLLFLWGLGIIVFIVVFLSYMYIKFANAYALTNKRVLIHKGLLSTKTISVDYRKITDVVIVEPFMDKIITHTGHIVIDTAGTNDIEIMLKHIQEPYEVKKKLDSLKDKVT